MLILINKKELMGEFRNGRAFNIISGIFAAVMVILTVAMFVTLLK
jgi:Mn2+/Fe2+ NRAMP family transporter